MEFVRCCIGSRLPFVDPSILGYCGPRTVHLCSMDKLMPPFTWRLLFSLQWLWVVVYSYISADLINSFAQFAADLRSWHLLALRPRIGGVFCELKATSNILGDSPAVEHRACIMMAALGVFVNAQYL